MERAFRKMLLEKIIQLSGGRGVLPIRQNEGARRRGVEIERAGNAPNTVQRGIGQGYLRLALHIIDDVQRILRETEGVRRTRGFQPQTLALIVYLKQEGQHIAHGQTQTDDLQHGADHAGLLPAASHGDKGKGKENEAKDGGGEPAPLEAEGIEHGEAAEDARVHHHMNSEKTIGHGNNLLNLAMDRHK